jgi:hypothetical protein
VIESFESEKSDKEKQRHTFDSVDADQLIQLALFHIEVPADGDDPNKTFGGCEIAESQSDIGHATKLGHISKLSKLFNTEPLENNDMVDTPKGSPLLSTADLLDDSFSLFFPCFLLDRHRYIFFLVSGC